MSPESTLETDSLDWLTLGDDEETLWAGKPHESSLVPALVAGVPLAFVLVGFAVIAAAYLSRENTQYVVTDRALYKKSGVLSRDVQRIDFGKVQNTSYAQGFFGARFGYGRVDVSTAGGSGVEMRFRAVPDPKGVQRLINRRVKSEPTRDEREESAADVLEDVLTELRAIREAVEAEDRETPTADTES